MRRLVRNLTVVAAGVVPWAATASPAGAIEPQTATVEWEFSPANGSGATCTLQGSGLVNTYEDGRVAIGRLTLLEGGPACRPALVSVVLDYTDSSGNRRRSTAFAAGATDLSTIGDKAALDAEAVVEVSVSYDGCATPAACSTSRVVRPK